MGNRFSYVLGLIALASAACGRSISGSRMEGAGGGSAKGGAPARGGASVEEAGGLPAQDGGSPAEAGSSGDARAGNGVEPGDGEVGAGEGTPDFGSESCARIPNPSLWSGNKLYLDDDPGCEGYTPCFDDVGRALLAAVSGDTIVFLPGTYDGFSLEQTDARPSLRFTGESGPDGVVIQGHCPRIRGDTKQSGEIWLDHFTFRDCGPSSSLVEDGWGLYVSTWSGVDVRIQDNLFVGDFGSGALGLDSSTVGTRFHATVARNRFVAHTGSRAGLDVNLPADFDEDYCVRVENNVFTGNRLGLGLQYTPFRDGAGRFEVVNNTFAQNQQAVAFAGPSGRYVFANNILFGNESDFIANAELGFPVDVRHNLIESGQFTGLGGNFTLDPEFTNPDAGDFHLLGTSPAAFGAEVAIGPADDIDGHPRHRSPSLGAYEVESADPTPLEGLGCGDGVVQRGPTTTPAGTFLGFETCDDGNRRGGDGCSELCQTEPHAAFGQISGSQLALCAIRADRTLACWGEVLGAVPAGTFQQVAVSAYQACALDDQGKAQCWRSQGASFAPDTELSFITSDYYGTCGLDTNGGIVCWDERAVTLEQVGDFARVDTGQRACGLTSAGELTCWKPYPSFPEGPFVQVYPNINDSEGCALRLDGTVVCIPQPGMVVDYLPRAGFAEVFQARDDYCALRPDGRLVQFRFNSMTQPFGDSTFVDVTEGGTVCCGLTEDRRVRCDGNSEIWPHE